MKSYLASRLFTQTQILGETYDLEDLIGILLRYLRKSAEEQFGEPGFGSGRRAAGTFQWGKRTAKA